MEATKKVEHFQNDTWKVANGEVVIINGEIQDNPFSNRLQSSKTTQWMIQNENLVKTRLIKLLKGGGVQGGDYEDCFDYSLDYFMSKRNRVFKKNFHGEGTSYSIAQYVLSQLPFVVQAYKSKLIPKKVEISPILDRNEATLHSGKVLDTMKTDQGEPTPESVLLDKDIKYWDTFFLDVLDWFNEFVEDQRYKKFDTASFIYHMWLFNRYEDIKLQLTSAASLSGMSNELAELVFKDVRLAVKNERAGAQDFLNGLLELIKAVQAGWKPKAVFEREV